MFLEESLTTILFRLINFAVFSALIFYVFKKYLLGTIRNQIASKKQALIDLHNRADTLVDDIRRIDQVIQQDVKMCQKLKKHVVEWRVRAEQIEQESLIQKRKQMNVLADHIRTQMTHLQRAQAFEQILPVVIDQTHATLEQKFEDEDSAQAFITQLITAMKKG